MKIKSRRKIKSTPEALWNYLGDYSNIYKFNPLIKHSDFNDGAATCEVGSTRQCDMSTGDFLKERITDWKEGSHYSIEVYETSMPIKSSKATLGLNKVDDQYTEAYMEMEVVPKYAILGPVMYLMFKFIAAPGILRGLEKITRSELQPKIVNV